jgi:hypothetical protein
VHRCRRAVSWVFDCPPSGMRRTRLAGAGEPDAHDVVSTRTETKPLIRLLIRNWGQPGRRCSRKALQWCWCGGGFVVVVLPNQRRFDPAVRRRTLYAIRTVLAGPADELVDLVTTNMSCPILDGPSFSAFCAEEWLFPVAQRPGSAPVLNVVFS